MGGVLMPYVTAVPLDELFSDSSYQRECDHARAKGMSVEWSPELVGVIDVSDRGEGKSPRYAIINGQHRWMAAKLTGTETHMAVNVHTGLSVEDEAKLFFDIDRKTKQLTNWDRWYARRRAGDFTVNEIERIVGECGLVVAHNPGPKNIQCCSKLERIWDSYDPSILADTLTLILDVWPGDQDALKTGILGGLSLVLDAHSMDINTGRLADGMSEMTAKQVLTRAAAHKEQGMEGGLDRLVGHVLVSAYNRTKGAKLSRTGAVA